MKPPLIFTKNRERLIEHDAVIELFNLVLEQSEHKGLLSGEHFSVDGTLIQAWAGHKSFVRKDDSDDDNDSDSRLRFMGHPSPTTVTDWWPTPWSPPQMALPSAKRPRR